MIRTTRTGFYALISHTTSRLASQLRATEEQAVTGLSINRPSDAPERLGEVHRLAAQSQDQTVWGSNADTAVGLLNAMDAALAGASDTLVSVRELALGVASETYSAEDRANAVSAVESLRQSMLSAANTEFGGRYLFAGTGYDDVAFDDTGAYVGTADAPSIQVGASLSVESGAVGSDVFQGGTDVFQMFTDLEAALAANDTAGISASLGQIDACADAITAARSRIGASSNAAQDAKDVSTSLLDMLGTRTSELASADPTETYMRLSQLQVAYDTTLQVAASAQSKTLFDFL